ncbi:MAG: putative transposase [Verrucomicrobiales bacterium]|jgi:putative transposase
MRYMRMPQPRRFLRPVRLPVYFHCISRVVDKNFVFHAHERDVFRKVMRQVEAFSGVKVITWTILSNHFHLLLEVPPVPQVPLSDDEILERCRALYSADTMIQIELEFESARRTGGAVLAALRSRFLKRMWDLSEFMKTLKQKFTSWFNREHRREGTLWERRFKSVMVEGSWSCLLKVAAYVDLNAVRAGLADDPKDYPWSGYAEAVAGDRAARRGLSSALTDVRAGANWRDLGLRYRKILFGIGEGTSERRGISREEVRKAWEAGGKLSLAQLLRCRLRYFSDGFAIGSEGFIEKVFQAFRPAFSEARLTGARTMSGGAWGELRVARKLRVNPVSLGGDG